MRGVTFHFSVPRYLAGRTLGRVTESALFGAASGLRLDEAPLPPLPGPDWARLEIIAGGICGTDLSTLAFQTSPTLQPFASFPAVFGHEVLAKVVEVGPGVSRARPGQRVAVDPFVTCSVRGFDDPCPSCAAGRGATCWRAGETGRLAVAGRPLAPGMCLGFHRDLPGGWSDAMLAHQSQLFPVDESLTDDQAVLIEPLSIAVHAVLGHRPDPSAPVLVIGSGPIALATVWALRALGHQGKLVAQTKRPGEAALARSLGASDAVSPSTARGELLATGARAYRPIIGPEVFAGGGFDAVFDCVGSPASLDQSLRFATPRGTIVVLGCAAMISKLDFTLLWARELVVRGFVGYGRERFEEGELHTFEVTQALLARSRSPVAAMVTSRFPLERYPEALSAVWNRARTGAIKVVLTPGRVT